MVTSKVRQGLVEGEEGVDARALREKARVAEKAPVDCRNLRRSMLTPPCLRQVGRDYVSVERV